MKNLGCFCSRLEKFSFQMWGPWFWTWIVGKVFWHISHVGTSVSGVLKFLSIFIQMSKEPSEGRESCPVSFLTAQPSCWRHTPMLCWTLAPTTGLRKSNPRGSCRCPCRRGSWSGWGGHSCDTHCGHQGKFIFLSSLSLGSSAFEQSLLPICPPFFLKTGRLHGLQVECSIYVLVQFLLAQLWKGCKRYLYSKRNEYRPGSSAPTGRQALTTWDAGSSQRLEIWEQTLWIGAKVQ